MKKTLSAIVFLSILFYGCSSSGGDEEPMPDPDPMGGPITYQSDVRPIITANCLSCHSDPPANNAPMPLTTYSDVRGAVETRGLLNRINSTTNPMPPSGRMPASTRQVIEDWVDQGFLEN